MNVNNSKIESFAPEYFKFEKLPQDIQVKIMSLMKLGDLALHAQVNKLFNRIAQLAIGNIVKASKGEQAALDLAKYASQGNLRNVDLLLSVKGFSATTTFEWIQNVNYKMPPYYLLIQAFHSKNSKLIKTVLDKPEIKEALDSLPLGSNDRRKNLCNMLEARFNSLVIEEDIETFKNLIPLLKPTLTAANEHNHAAYYKIMKSLTHLACRNNQPEMLQEILKVASGEYVLTYTPPTNHDSVELCPPSHIRLFVEAAQLGHKEIIELLLDQTYIQNCLLQCLDPKKKMFDSLHEVLDTASYEISDLILKKLKTVPSAQDLENIELLNKLKFDTTTGFQWSNNSTRVVPYYPLTLAFHSGDSKRIKDLLDDPAIKATLKSIPQNYNRDRINLYKMLEARFNSLVIKGDIEKFEELISLLEVTLLAAKYDSSSKFEIMRSLAYLACTNNQPKILKKILEVAQGDYILSYSPPTTDLFFQNKNRLLVEAAQLGHKEVLKVLLDQTYIQSCLFECLDYKKKGFCSLYEILETASYEISNLILKKTLSLRSK
ncbi:MAG: hypothetical protein K0S74_667 [Chlamydiales bacterium]|jgi:hypothetical protein|nr:hypothetical protein [Chlamydiales bacterium]